MHILKINSTAKLSHTSHTCANFKTVASQLKDVAPLYPHFKSWLYFTFKPGFERGLRSIISARIDGRLAGLALLKNDAIEKKICTFFVLPEFREQGIGSKLMKESLAFLDSSETFISVSEERDSELFPLLSSNGFRCSSRITGYYRKDKYESFYKLQ